MRSRLLVLVACVVSVASLRCGSVDQGGGSVGGGPDAGAGGSDAGASGSDAGTGGTDAGTGGGSSDAGGGPADAGGGGTDGGGGSGATCTQAGPTSVASRSYVIDPAGRDPGYTAGDGSGTMMFVVTAPGAPGRNTEASVVASDGTLKNFVSFAKPAILHGDAVGFSGVIAGFSGSFTVEHRDSSGQQAGVLSYQTSSNATAPVLSFADPRDGTLLLGDFRASAEPESASSRRAAFVRGAPPAQVWKAPLAGTGVVFGAGLDLASNALAILDGSPRFGAGAISAQWFTPTGAAQTDEFLLFSAFEAGTHTWFETSALADGGVAIRRVDSPEADGRVQSSQYLCVLRTGTTTCEKVPDWLAARSNARIEPIRNGAAYAVLPDPQSVSDCSQRVELLDANGASCGTTDLPMAQGACVTRPLSVGKDGTLIQTLADPAWQCGPGSRPCRPTYRWYPGMFR